MDAEQLFSVAGLIVIPAWLLLVLLPRWQWTKKIVYSGWIPMLLAGLYIVSMIVAQPTPSEGNFNSLAGVMILFQSPWLVLAGWIHYLAFDLFIGAWEVRDAQRVGLNHLWVIPCLFLTFMAGPVGLLLYFLLRLTKTRSLNTTEA